MASAFITYSYQINFESVLMMHDHDGILNMFKALETSGVRGFLGCESVLYEKELVFETALVHGEDITGAVSGKFFSISQAQFAHVFALPTEGLINFSEVPKDKVYDARTFFSKKGEQVEIHGKKKPMKYEFRLLNDILAKAVTVKAGSFDAVTVERFQMMTSIHYGLKVNWGKVLFNVLKDMVDKSQRKAKDFAVQIVNTYIATNTTIDAREEQGMVSEATVKRTPKSKKKSSSADDTPVKIISEIAGSKKRVAIDDNAPTIPKNRRTVKTKPSFSQASLDIVNVAQDVVPIQVIDPTPAVATITSPAPKRKSRKRRLVLSTGSDDETVGTQEIVKDADAVVVTSTDEEDIIIAKVLEETLELGVSETERGGQGVDEAVFEEDFARWLDDFVARNSEPEFVDTMIDTRAESSISPVVDKEMNKFVDREQVTEETMSIDDLLLQISVDLMLPSITAVELTKIRLGESLNFGDVQERDLYSASLPRISSHDNGKGILVEDESVRPRALNRQYMRKLSKINHSAHGGYDPSREMRVRYCRSPSHPGKKNQQQYNKQYTKQRKALPPADTSSNIKTWRCHLLKRRRSTDVSKTSRSTLHKTNHLLKLLALTKRRRILLALQERLTCVDNQQAH
ncbi:dystroglycan-like [Dorcoceras hygrometricum]|uniref:Dystroglycan-like n=1 Tax=Dorcoceras hygrometricum TaxID=472368 RepID=A0A2Z7D5F4_9LAMI|nr:dystroglycan-like [Dorcoceras hygrometricum]